MATSFLFGAYLFALLFAFGQRRNYVQIAPNGALAGLVAADRGER